MGRVEESTESIVVWADLPGVDESDLAVTIDGKVLTLQGQVHDGKRPSARLVHREYHEGDFRRAFTISDAIDRERISAHLKDGVLRLELPKSNPQQPRKITVSCD